MGVRGPALGHAADLTDGAGNDAGSSRRARRHGALRSVNVFCVVP